ncbi:hypothetical protein NA57DRAFT_58850 [Rhizodiscina lignyota]|uniref:Uncharacterized protein n=1 Tax=Rhizodiscina lignyota TaxID=1504668 RepID=A0A9P4IC08_9PEZI|nr:hypothetical protein NA57DRAFT_58850 [Rhizodiscina lignyota]
MGNSSSTTSSSQAGEDSMSSNADTPHVDQSSQPVPSAVVPSSLDGRDTSATSGQPTSVDQLPDEQQAMLKKWMRSTMMKLHRRLRVESQAFHTKHTNSLRQLRNRLRTGMESLRTDFETGLRELRDLLHSETESRRTEVATVQRELQDHFRTEIETIRAEVTTSLRKDIDELEDRLPKIINDQTHAHQERSAEQSQIITSLLLEMQRLKTQVQRLSAALEKNGGDA